MTTLNLEDQIRLMVRERAFVMSRMQPGEEVEFETRLGVKPGASGTNGLFWINAYQFVRKIAERKTWANYTHTIISDVYVTFRKRDSDWTRKSEIRSEVISNNWAKISLATEKPSHAPTPSNKYKKTTRYISRHSFYIGISRVDFTKTYTDGVLTYEVEVEYLAPAKMKSNLELENEYIKKGGKIETGSYKEFLESKVKANVDSYIELIYRITSAMFLTPLPFTYNMLLLVSAIGNTVLGRPYEGRTEAALPYIDRRYMSEAIDLDIKKINQASLFSGGRTWTVCLKTDGERRLLVICDQGTWLLYPPRQAALYSKTETHFNSRVTIADGELYRGEFWVIDALWVDGIDLRGSESHLSRCDIFKRWEEGAPRDLFGEGPKKSPGDLFERPLPIRYKRERTLITSSNFFTKVQAVWSSRHTAGYPVDGLIFTPEEATYEQSTDEDNRIILKWKPNITIDLIVSKSTAGNLVVFGAAEDRSEEQFIGNESSKLRGIDMRDVPYNRGAVVEFECKNGNLLALRERPEKEGPNRMSYAVPSWLKATVDTLGVSKDTLLGKNNVLMRKYHNRIKMSLIQNAAGDDTILLDIGSGRGGDLSKWKQCGYSKIICVEPSKDNLKKLRARLSDMSPDFQDRVLICEARGEDTTFIKNFATKNRIDSVHVVSMMDSLTYFFDKKGKSLTALARTVNSLLVNGGLFIWKSLDGASVTTAFDSMPDLDILTYGDSSITRIDSNTVRINIPPNQVDIEENLTDIRALKQALDLSGEPKSAQGESLLTSSYATLSRLFTYGSFIKGKKLAPTREMMEVFKYTSLKKITTSDAHTSVIEAIESTFSSLRHSTLITEYGYIALEIDTDYAAVGTEPEYYNFETAYLGYFSSSFLEKSRTRSDVLEVDVIRDIRLDDKFQVHASLAFASLLKLDVFVVGEDLELLFTNSVEGRTTNPCCIVIITSEGYKLKPFSNGLPIALSTDASVARYARNPYPDFHDLIREDIGQDYGLLLSANKHLKTNILNRLAYIEGVPWEIRYRSLANRLLNDSSNGCTQRDLEACGIGSEDYGKLIKYVDRKMEELLIARDS